MYFVYILFSATRNKYYVGTSSDPQVRLVKHNTNHRGFTGRTGDWKLKHLEEFAGKDEALKRERQIKNWKSRRMIEGLFSQQN